MTEQAEFVLMLLKWIMVGGGSGVAAYFLFDLIKDIPGYGISSKYERILSLLLASVIAGLAYAGGVWLGLFEDPVTAQGWTIAIIAAASPSMGVSQSIHGLAKLE